LNYVVTANWELKQTVIVLFSNSLFNLELIWNLLKMHIIVVVVVEFLTS